MLAEALRNDYRNDRPRSAVAQARGHLALERAASTFAQVTVGGEAELVFVGIGTTGLCNASCIHCPTGKPETGDAPRTPMPMVLFTKLVEGLQELNISVKAQMSFGLFGDGLVDPFVRQRADLVRERLPEVNLSVNTNGAAYNRERHRDLRTVVNVIALHTESLIPEVYDDLMRPLRAERVFEKHRQILEDFEGMVDVSVPVSVMNLAELSDIRDYFVARRARGVHFDPLSSRCARDQEVFCRLALDPFRKRCGPRKAQDLVIDCDGKVLMCCNDFSREEVIGDLASESVADLLLNSQRRLMAKQFAGRRHDERATCARCHADFRKRGRWDEMVGAALSRPARDGRPAAIAEVAPDLTV